MPSKPFRDPDVDQLRADISRSYARRDLAMTIGLVIAILTALFVIAVLGLRHA